MLKTLREGFLSLKGSSHHLYLILAINALDSFSRCVQWILCPLFLTNQWGIPDTQAGLSCGLWGTLVALSTIFLSPVADSLGVKKSLIIGLGLAGVGRALMAFAHSTTVIWISLYGVMPVAQGFISTMVVVGVKRYANPAGRGFAYALFCSFKNVAVLMTGLLYDVFRRTLVNGLKLDVWGSNSPLNDGTRLYLLVTVVCTVCAFVLSLFLDETATVDDVGHADVVVQTQAQNLGEASNNCGGKISKFIRDLKHSSSSTLLKYMIVCTLTVNMRLLFDHVEATFPKYQIRAFGCNAPVGLTYSINPLMVIFLVPIIQAMLTRINPYDVIHLGSYITGLSPFILVLSQTKWASAMFISVLSIGEAIWSPGWYGYSMLVAPHGREALYTGLTSVPLLLGRVLTGWLSGWLLETWCPRTKSCGGGIPLSGDPVHCDGRMVWLIVGTVVFASPVGLLLGSRWLQSSGAHKGGNIDEKQNADEQEPLLR